MSIIIEKPHAKLIVYHGNCPSYYNGNGCGEGLWHGSPRNSYEKANYYAALGIVMGQIRDDYKLVNISDNSLISSEEKAKELYNILKKDFEESEVLFSIVGCAHGVIRFNRKIILGNVLAEQKKDLVSKIISTGLITNERYADLEYDFRWDDILGFFLRRC